MIAEERCIVVDIDGTICQIKGRHESYETLEPCAELVSKLRDYRAAGFYIILYTSRNMRTYEANLGRIMAKTARFTLDWLDRNDVPYDEIHFGKPWAGRTGFYVDDRAVRPDEFLRLSLNEIMELLEGKQAKATTVSAHE